MSDERELPLYARRDLEALGGHYPRHLAAMTAEGLRDKSDVAAELAWRDAEIERLRAEGKERMFRVRVFHAVDKKSAVRPTEERYGGRLMSVGFNLERVLSLPFAPFPGLMLVIPGAAGTDPAELRVKTVDWDTAEAEFFVTTPDENSYDFPGGMEEMERVASAWEDDGFVVDRSNMMGGKWVEAGVRGTAGNG